MSEFSNRMKQWLDENEVNAEVLDFGIDYIECASCKLLNEQGATELGPYVCAVDKVASEMLGWGLR